MPGTNGPKEPTLGVNVFTAPGKAMASGALAKGWAIFAAYSQASTPTPPPSVHQELSRHIESITLLPKGDSVQYKSDWKLLGDRERAEGQNRTAYAGLFRAALYR